MSDTRFQPGNPGRPPGRPDRRTELRKLLEPHAPALIEKVVELARSGDTTALRICIDRLIPPIKAKDTAIHIPALTDSIADNARVVVKALADGEITPDEAGTVLAAFASQVRVVEAAEIEKRITALEAAANRKV